MRHLLLFGLLTVVGCTPAQGDANPAGEKSVREYPSVTQAPSPDYARMLANPAPAPRGEIVREASGQPPADAKAIGEEWIRRLEERGALMGYGLAGKGTDGPASSIDTLLTAREFDAWVAENSWQVPGHIAWRFQHELSHPRTSDTAEQKIRFWPASSIRTGWQLEAMEGGRIVLRDGCFRVQVPGQEERLAWFHAETGLDVDGEGYLVLIDRATGQTMARVGELMNWAGPNAVAQDSEGVAALHAACGQGEVHGVGNPQARERLYVEYPHLREPLSPPPPPDAR